MGVGESTHRTKGIIAFTGNMHYRKMQFVSVLLSVAQTTQLNERERSWTEVITA
jgi:hypothetical protein